MGDDVSSWRRQANGLPQGSLLASTLFNLYTSDLLVTCSCRFIYADDICCALQAETFSEIECTLTADLAHLAKFCQPCRLIPSTSKTVTSVFHLHNNRSRRELNVHMDGQRLKHDPVYLGVTLDQALSYREHLSRSAEQPELKQPDHETHGMPVQAPSLHQPWLYAAQSQNTAVQCGLNPATQISSTPNFVVQCAWFQAVCNPRSSHGCQCSAMLHLLLYVVKRQPRICFKSSRPIQIGLCMLVYLSIHLHDLHLDSWHPIWSDMTSVDTNTQCREDWSSASVVNHTIVTDPTIRQSCFHLPHHTWSLMNRFQIGNKRVSNNSVVDHRSPCHVNLHKWGLTQSPSCDCGQPQIMNHTVDTCPLTPFEGGLNLLHEADDDAVIWLESTATAALNEINNTGQSDMLESLQKWALRIIYSDMEYHASLLLAELDTLYSRREHLMQRFYKQNIDCSSSCLNY